MSANASTTERGPLIIIASGVIDSTQLERLGATVIYSDNPVLLVRLIKCALDIDPGAPSWAELQLERAIWGRR